MRIARKSADFPAKKRNGEHYDGHAAKHDERELPRGDEDEDQAADEDHGVAHCLGDCVEQGVADDAEVRGNAVAEGSGALLLIERHGQFHQVRENVATKPVERRLAGADESLDAEVGDDGLNGEHADEHQNDAVRFF